LIINILQHNEILRSAQDDTVSGLIKGGKKRRFDTDFESGVEFGVRIASSFPLSDPKMHCHPER